MPEHKSAAELAAEMTIAALSKTSDIEPLSLHEKVCEFYRAVYEEIRSCADDSPAN